MLRSVLLMPWVSGGHTISMREAPCAAIDMDDLTGDAHTRRGEKGNERGHILGLA